MHIKTSLQSTHYLDHSLIDTNPVTNTCLRRLFISALLGGYFSRENDRIRAGPPISRISSPTGEPKDESSRPDVRGILVPTHRVDGA